ncbi:scaffold protein Nfu/NifU N terminal-domain-containing protein [Lentinula lateritia]|uniref:Scaffold protein Nfu/NifU N terminal-domain-containing protein n=1 Tax=Lentinula lateritia TaxID=40482 RepID=A0ABQ8VSG6_9AGAR|nr:scaffold protein Nfu/NifU N terminal-domain-containing protein [Lentinula lateritia]
MSLATCARNGARHSLKASFPSKSKTLFGLSGRSSFSQPRSVSSSSWRKPLQRHYATATPTSPGLSSRPATRQAPPLTRSMFIQTESTPNDDSLKFVPGVSVMGEGTAEFLDTRSALSSPLAIRLMGVEGVKAIFYGPDFVTVSKDSEHPWAVIKPEIYSTLMEHFSSGQALFRSQEERDNAGPQDTRIYDTDSETVAMIKELLETRVRPAIMEDGGDIEYRGFDETGSGMVKVKLKGSCRGCDSSTVTLKSGIERMLMHYIPEVKGVEQVLDEEEQISLNEFNKLEKKLNKESRQESSPMAQYMSA